jgi:hypothetical protein
MDNSTNLSDLILKSSETSSSPSSINVVSSTSTDSDSGFFSFITKINLTTWLIIILIFAFLGFNIFVYLAKGTQDITNFFSPLIQTIFGTLGKLTGEVVDVSAEGAKSVVNETASIIDNSLTAVQNATPGGLNATSSLPNQSVQSAITQKDMTQNNTLNKALNTSQQTQQKGPNDYEPHEATSSVTGKAGWCYIGEDRGFRSCSQVGVNDVCMSGDIFPSNELCVNPNLRP